MMAPPPPPNYGTGPVNFSNPADAGPFAAFGNQINYQNMMRYQMVAQYQQQQPTQYNLPASVQQRVLTDPRYSYGVPGGQNRDYYNRQAELNRMAYSGALTTGTLGMASWSAAAAPLAAMGLTGFGVAIPAMALTAPIGMTIGSRVNQNLERHKFMHSIALDLQMNRERLGMRGLTYNEASMAGGNLADFMIQSSKGGYFDKNQLMRIQKLGISEGILSARGGPGGGSIQQFEKNAKDLFKSVEDIMKMMNTTIEGGMSIIKEMNQIGFTKLPQIKSQIRMAQAAGGVTGMGFQNTMMLGQAGAQAVQGTPWNAAVGASMYQMGAVAAYTIAGASPRAAYAVERVGGVAQAGAVIANAQMNILQSGIGTRIAAYAMNPDGSINRGRLDSMLSGNVSAFETVMGANRTGYAMGQNRVRFGMFKADMMNQLSDAERMGLTRQAFRMWGQQRGGNLENKAAVFARQFTQDPNSQRLLYESLLGSSGFNRIAGEAAYQQAIRADVARMQTPSPITKAIGSAWRAGVRDPLYAATDVTMGAIDYGVRSITGAGKGIGFGATWLANQVTKAWTWDRYGAINQGAGYGDWQTAAALSYGTATRAGDVGRGLRDIAVREATGADMGVPRMTRLSFNNKIDFDKLIRTRSAAETNEVLRATNTRVMMGGSERAWNDTNMMKYMGFTWKDLGVGKGQMAQAMYSLNAGLMDARNSIRVKHNTVTGRFDNWMETQSAVQKAGIYKEMDRAHRFLNVSSSKDMPTLEKSNGAWFLHSGDRELKVRREIGEKVIADRDFELNYKKIQGLRASSVDLIGVKRGAVDTIRGALAEYSGRAISTSTGLNVNPADVPAIRTLSGETTGYISSEWEYGRSATQGGLGRAFARGLSNAQMVREYSAKKGGFGGFVGKVLSGIAGTISMGGVKATTAMDVRSMGKYFGARLGSADEVLAFANKLEAVGAAGSRPTDKLTNEEQRILALYDTEAGKKIREAAAGIRRSEAYQAAEGLANQAEAMGINVSATDIVALAAKPERQAEKMMSQLQKMTGQTKEGIRRLAKLESRGEEGGIISQLFGRQMYTADKSYRERLNQLITVQNQLRGKEDFAIIENATVGGQTYKDERASIIKEAADSEMKNLQTEIAIAGLEKGGRGGGNSASVAAPVMNYWNNRWVL